MSANKKEGANMNEREQLILKAIIKHYLEFGESVGSRLLKLTHLPEEFRQVKDINYMWRNLLR